MMKAMFKASGAFFFLLLMHAMYPALAQEATFQMRLAMDLPVELNMDKSSSCRLEFQEVWIIDPARSSIRKTVDAFEFPCTDTTESVRLPDGTTRLKHISYEFIFLDLPDKLAKEVQKAIINLVNESDPIAGVYDPSEQLLSIYFHEEWLVEPGTNSFSKKIRGITPVIWQRRQTADGEPIPDPDTGYPVFYKHSLERIELRQP
jgi:hypothetical protein